VAVYEDSRALGRLDGVCLHIVDTSREIVSVGVSWRFGYCPINGRVSYVNWVFCAVRRIRGAVMELIVQLSFGRTAL
jgi:hypothetical protein